MKKIRVDQLLVDQNLAITCAKAQALIMSGCVYVGSQQIKKPSELFLCKTKFDIKGKGHPYVGRGGVKLKAALDAFAIFPKNKICLDIGVSTGGFTDCLLQEGAKKVYAVDVGYGQLDWKLRQDSRVILFEKTNFRYFDVNLIHEKIDLVVVDVSFISLDKIIPKIKEIFSHCPSPLPLSPRRGERPLPPPLREGVQGEGESIHSIVIFLIKPQFEVEPEFVEKGGIVRNELKRMECVQKITNLVLENKMKLIGSIPSPLLGNDGNQEYLLAATWMEII